MKTSILKSVFLIALFSIIGCSSDSEEEVACTPTPCFNGGISTPTCGCDCPEGFTGADCFDQKTPTKVLITKINVLSFPNYAPSGFAWDDIIGKPDIYVTLFDAKETFFASSYYKDAISNSSNIYEFIPTKPIELSNVSDYYGIRLKDLDEKGVEKDDDMGSTIFVPFLKPSSLPKTIIVQNEKSNLKFEIFLTYVFK